MKRRICLASSTVRPPPDERLQTAYHRRKKVGPEVAPADGDCGVRVDDESSTDRPPVVFAPYETAALRVEDRLVSVCLAAEFRSEPEPIGDAIGEVAFKRRAIFVAESEVTEAFVFPPGRLEGSVGRNTFRAALKRLAGVDLPAAMTANSFAELIQQGGSAEAPASVPTSTPSAAPASPALPAGAEVVEIGVDIEDARNLPWSGDPWSEPFYLENFSKPEIAYCTRQANPRLSLCGLWAAKEAAIKCASASLKLTPAEIEVGHESDRRPFLCSRDGVAGEFFRSCRLSISHAGDTAVAACVRTPASLGAPPKSPTTQAPLQPALSSAGAAAAGRGGAVLVAVVSLLLSLMSLALWTWTWWRRH